MKIRHILACARIAVLSIYFCTIQPDPPSVKVRNAVQAIGAVLSYLRDNSIENTPIADTKWQEKILYSPGPPDFAITSKLFTSGDWQIEVSQGVAPLNRTVYQVILFNARIHLYWKGSVKADGTITEDSPFKQLSEEESQQITKEFLRKSQVPPPAPGGYGH